MYCHFSLQSQMVPQQTAKFRTTSFCHFHSTLRKDSVANYGSIWTLFLSSVRGLDVLYNALNVSYFRPYVAPQDSQIFGRNFPKCKKIGCRVVPNTSYGYYWDKWAFTWLYPAGTALPSRWCFCFSFGLILHNFQNWLAFGALALLIGSQD